MTDETTALEGALTGAPAPEADNTEQQPAAVPSEGEPSQGATPAPSSESKPKTEWYYRRVAQEAERRRQAEQRARDLEAQIAAHQQANQPEGQPPPAPQNVDQLVQARAAELQRQNEIARTAATIFEQGTKAFPDYKDAVENFSAQAGDLVHDPVFLETLFDIPDSHTVLHHLGHNPEEAEKILALSPHKRSLQLGRLAESLKSKSGPKPTATAPTSAPPPEPVRPVGASSKTSKNMETWTAADWDRYYQEKRQGR